MTLFSTKPPPPPPQRPEQPPLETHLSAPILLAERVINSATESTSFKLECAELVKNVDSISTMLRTVVRFVTTAATTVYDRPIRRITTQVGRTLQRAYNLLRKVNRRRNFLYRILNLVTTADFKKILSLLAVSTADLRWLISILHVDNSVDPIDENALVLSLPPICSNDPILAWVWSFSTAVQMGGYLPARVEAAYEIASLAKDSDRNKKIIVEEGGVWPLLKLLKDSSVIDGQIAAAIALFEVASNAERVGVVVDSGGVECIVNVLGDSPLRVQCKVSELVARLVDYDEDGFVREEFGRENVIRPLVSLLSFETFQGEFGSVVERKQKEVKGKEKEKENVKPRVFSSCGSFSSLNSDVGSKVGRKSRENESPEVKKAVKVNCARALWLLAKDSVANSKRICETKGLLCLAKLIQVERGVLQKYCIMAVMEITLAAEANVDLRRSVFKTSSPAAKAVVEQLLRVIKECEDSKMRIAAVRSIGSLSRTFPARETRVIEPLVEQLGNNDNEVATEALIALGKFADPDNFLCNEHSKTIIELKVVVPILRLLRASQKAQIRGLILLCYLAINASNTEAFEQARVLAALKGVEHTLVAQNPQLRELIVKAVYHLDIYHGESNPLRQSSLRI